MKTNPVPPADLEPEIPGMSLVGASAEELLAQLIHNVLNLVKEADDGRIQGKICSFIVAIVGLDIRSDSAMRVWGRIVGTVVSVATIITITRCLDIRREIVIVISGLTRLLVWFLSVLS